MKKIDPNSMGYLLRKRRLKLQMSQRELAEKIGFKDESFVGRYERNEIKIPVDTFVKICRILQIPNIHEFGSGE